MHPEFLIDRLFQEGMEHSIYSVHCGIGWYTSTLSESFETEIVSFLAAYSDGFFSK